MRNAALTYLSLIQIDIHHSALHSLAPCSFNFTVNVLAFSSVAASSSGVA